MTVYIMRLNGVRSEHESLGEAIAAAQAQDGRITALSGASGGALHHYTTLHLPRVGGEYDPIGERVGIIAWPGYHFLAD